LTASLSLECITYNAGGKTIVDEVSIEVAQRETLALLGPSGAGKTTLLRIVAGLEPPSAGKVNFEGRDVTRVPAHRRGFGFMFQDHALFPHMDVAENIEFGLRRAGWAAARRRERVAELLGLVGLEGFGNRKIERLSGGERQRVALARALAPEPRLLMLDEPLGSLDRGLRERLVAELREILARLAIPAIYVTHDQFEAFAIADRVAILEGGHVERIDTPQALWANPGSPFVARFLGMQNILDGVRDGVGLVRTVLGTFGPLPGPEGKVKLLLRDVGARLVLSPGPNTASGAVEFAVFRGAVTQLRIGNGDAALEFSIPGDSLVPPAGTTVHVRAAGAEVLEEWPDSRVV